MTAQPEESDKPATRLKTFRESLGCPVPRVLKFHDFQWGLGPGNGGWWMYCTRCGKGVWR